MEQSNPLFPVFFRLDHFQVLIVGGGYIGLEKATALLKSSNNAQITLVAPQIKEEIQLLAAKFPKLILIQKEYDETDLSNKGLVMAATSIRELNERVYRDAKSRQVLINVADTPELCDFYLGSMVTKGDLKIAISTNGKSPTLAKRIRELLEDAIPENISALLDNLKTIQKKLKGDFEYKVQKMNEITTILKNDDKLE